MDKDVNFTLNDLVLWLEQCDVINFLHFLGAFGISFTGGFYVSSKLRKKYKLNKEFIPRDISSVSMPPELVRINSNVNMEMKLSSEYGEFVSLFIDRIINKVDDKNLTIFYNNINSLLIKKVDHFEKDVIMGKYDNVVNKILVKEIFSLFHEMFHMCSSVSTDNVLYVGFLQQHKNYFIGQGVNEGYTQLIAERYFGDIDGVLDSGYLVEKKFMKRVELIVGKEIMEELYFNANLYGLIVNLEKYNSIDNIMKFIIDMDFIKKYLSNDVKDSFIRKELIKKMNWISLFLMETYFNKILCDTSLLYLTEEQMDEFINFCPEFCIRINDKKYKIPNFNEYINLLDEIITVDDDRYMINSRNNYKKRELKRIYLCR